MKSFWNDYWDLVKESTDFYKKHWLGIVIMYIIIFVSSHKYPLLCECKHTS